MWRILFADMVVFSNLLASTKVKCQPYCFRSPTNGKKGMICSEEAGEVEGGWGRWPRCGTATLARWWIPAGAHVCMLHLITHQQTPPMSAIQAGQSRHWRHVIDEAAVIFSALVLCCLCHRPLCDHGPPRFSTLVAASLSAEWHGTVYISAKLALPFGPTLLHFRLLADAVIRGRQTGKWAQREETLPTSQRWQDAWWPLDSKPKPFWAWVRESVHHRWYLSCVLKSYCNLLIHKWV